MNKPSRARLQPINVPKMSPSWPAMPTAAAATARFCGDSIHLARARELLVGALGGDPGPEATLPSSVLADAAE